MVDDVAYASAFVYIPILIRTPVLVSSERKVLFGWFVLRENYCSLVTDKPNEQGVATKMSRPWKKILYFSYKSSFPYFAKKIVLLISTIMTINVLRMYHAIRFVNSSISYGCAADFWNVADRR
jgi:hypothetical protein